MAEVFAFVVSATLSDGQMFCLELTHGQCTVTITF